MLLNSGSSISECGTNTAIYFRLNCFIHLFSMKLSVAITLVHFLSHRHPAQEHLPAAPHALPSRLKELGELCLPGLQQGEGLCAGLLALGGEVYGQ